MASQLDNDHNVISVIPFLSLKSDKRDLENIRNMIDIPITIKVDGFIVLHVIHGYLLYTNTITLFPAINPCRKAQA